MSQEPSLQNRLRRSRWISWITPHRLRRDHLEDPCLTTSSGTIREEAITKEELERTNCYLCHLSVRHELDPNSLDAAKRYRLFHEPCIACDVDYFQADACPYCRHLRVRHLIKCLPADSLTSLVFRIGREPLNPDCPLCYFRELGPKEHQYEIAFGQQSNLVSGQESKPGQQCNIREILFERWDWIPRVHLLSYVPSDGIHSDVAKRQVGRLNDNCKMVAWDRLRNQLTECELTHPSCRPRFRQQLPPQFRVIDVNNRRVVELDEPRYVCLSYVWGDRALESYSIATRKTIASLQRVGGLTPESIPRTIEDAMTACKELGEKYLWCDKLCIFQDDSSDMMTQIKAMNVIYSSAIFVLIAAHGTNVECSIPGIGNERHVIKEEQGLMDLRFLKLVNHYDPLVWKTRAWTYQEAVLASRALTFTENGVEFACRVINRQIEPFDYLSISKPPIEYNLSNSGESQLVQFTRHLESYSHRSLTYRSDTYNAFLGIYKSIYGNTQPWVYGLPRIHFSQGLLWNRIACKAPIVPYSESDPIFPTWSWSSIDLSSRDIFSQIHFYDGMTSFCGALCVWYTRFASVELTSLEALNTSHDSNDGTRDWQVPMAIAYSESCLIKPPFSPYDRFDTWTKVHSYYANRWPTYGLYCKDLARLSQAASKNAFDSCNLKPGALFTITDMACFRLSAEQGRQESDVITIMDGENSRIGCLCGSNRDPTYQEPATYDFIAISVSRRVLRYDESGLYPFGIASKKAFQDRSGTLYPDDPMFLGSDALVVDVLMIGWHDEYAYRRELGWVFLKDWVKAKRRLETIRLE